MRSVLTALSFLFLLLVPASEALPLVPTPPASTPAAELEDTPFVQQNGVELYVDGAPWKFVGINAFNLASNDSCYGSVGASKESLDLTFDEMGDGVQVARVWFFQALATTDGARDWAALDRVVQAAREHGVRLIPTLGNQWEHCETHGFRGEEWYKGGYREADPEMPVSYREWVAEVVERYKDEPQIAMWQLINEATAVDGDEKFAPCRSSATDSLESFATDMAQVAKSADPNHLLSLGTYMHWCGVEGEEITQLYSVPGIDVCDIHDYGSPLEALPQGVRAALQRCWDAGKPTMLGEAGITPTDELEGNQTAERRAELLAKKMEAALEVGMVGWMAWDWRDSAHGGSSTDGWHIGPGDPFLDSLETAAAHLRQARNP